MIERAVVEAGGVVTVMQQKRLIDAKTRMCLQKHALIALCALKSRVSACSSLSYTFIITD